MLVGEPSLDQVRIFLAVEAEGSFGGAARRMGRAISAISYGVQQMEAQLGVVLFEREGSRKPVLTEAGRGLLSEAKAVADAADALLAKARGLHAGLESDIAVVIDVMVPSDAVAQMLREFRRVFPTVALRLNMEALGAAPARFLEGKAQLAVVGPVARDHPTLERRYIGQIELVPVAAPDHPLATGRPAPGECRRHLQLVLSDRSSFTEKREFSVLSTRTWRLADLAAKHALLKEGIGWGNMPAYAVREDIATGRLVRLDLPERPGAFYTLSAIWRRDAPPGPAARWLIESMCELLA